MNMNKYLGSKDERILTILEYLTFKKNHISIEEIESLVNCSNRTVYNDIEEISTRFSEELDVDYYNNNLMVKNISYSIYESIRQSIFKESKPVLLLQSLFTEPKISAKELAKKNEISISHTYNLIRRLNKLLLKDEISLDLSNLTFSSVSDTKLKFFLTNLFFINKKHLDCEIYKAIDRELQYVIAVTPEFKIISVNKPLKEYLLVFLYITYICDLHDNFMEESIPSNKKNLLRLNELTSIKNLTECIRDQVLFSIERVDLRIQPFEKKIHSCDFFKSNIDSRKTLEKIYLYIGLTQYFEVDSIILYERFILAYNSLSDTNPELVRELKQIIMSTVSEDYLLNEDEKRLKILVSLLVMFNPDINVINSKNILVLSDLSRIHAENICYKIKENFSEHNYDFQLLSDFKMNNKDISNVDYVISNVSLKTVPKDKQILINDLIVSDDIVRIHTYLKS